METAFLDWFSGFFAGEGWFDFRRDKRHRGYHCHAGIGLRGDDVDILLEIQTRLRIGKVTAQMTPSMVAHGNNPACRWRIARQGECLRLIEIFDAHPLRNSKGRPYKVWREAILELTKPLEQRNHKYLGYLADRLSFEKHYHGEVEEAVYEPVEGRCQLSFWEEDEEDG